ncbi:GNAT family N-acetyltransferase [Streptomyces aureoversilis]|uniref:GNAT family N-acetyltransferase n=1 Tax=Streptomyces aureoversilis TaxID=67277 RepID=A0ABW0A379_9ACTN
MSDHQTAGARARVLAEGPRVAIRAVTPEDGPEFTRLVRDSADLHRPWLSMPTTEEGFAQYAARFDGEQRAGFLVCLRDSGRPAGFVNINNIVRGAFLCGALGYGAFVPSAGRGLMSEGFGLVLRHAFGPLGLHRLEANIQPGNTASLALVKRHGFRLEGFSPDFLFIGGAWRDHERWAITADMPQEHQD